MIETIDQYQENKAIVLEEGGEDGYISTAMVARIIDVPFKEIRNEDELSSIRGIPSKIGSKYKDLTRMTRIKDMENYKVSDLIMVILIRSHLRSYFIMKNKLIFSIRQAELGVSILSSATMEDVLLLFEKFKMKELRDRATWVPIINRFEILDL